MVSVTLILSACANSYYGHWSPAWSPDGTKIAFHSTDKKGWTIYVINSDGSKQTILTKSRGGDRNPAWSPDGTKIAFTSGGVKVMNSAGSNQTNLVGGMNPAWSPDGRKIAFSSGRTSDYEINSINVDGSNQVNLTQNPARDTQPTWSPDGTRIAFVSDRDGNGEIYVMNADGSNPVKITSSASAHAANYPAWSPDGSKIAFGRATRSWLWSDIYLINADGTNLTNLTPKENSYAPSKQVTSGLTWSPDGTKIAFAGHRPGWNEMHVEIYVMDSDGSNQTRLTLKPGVDSMLSLLPVPVVLLLGFLLMIGLPIAVVFLIIWREGTVDTLYPKITISTLRINNYLEDWPQLLCGLESLVFSNNKEVVLEIVLELFNGYSGKSSLS